MTLTILEQHLQHFEGEFQKEGFFHKEKEHQYRFSLTPIQNGMIRYLDPGILFSCFVHPLPSKNLETFFMNILSANYLGQGTGNGWLGLEPNEKYLTLSMAMPYEVNYMEFREMLEEFLNLAEFWKIKVDDFIKKQV